MCCLTHSHLQHGQCCVHARFFYNAQDYQDEVALYQDADLRALLPELLAANNNANGAVRSSTNFVFPPHIVLERGITLTEWVRTYAT